MKTTRKFTRQSLPPVANKLIVEVKFDTNPTSALASVPNLKYNKKNWLSLDFDDASQSSISALNFFANKFYTDGCGNNKNYTFSIALNGANETSGEEYPLDGSTPGQLTKAFLMSFLNLGGDVSDHGYYHDPVGFGASMTPLQSTIDMQDYIQRKLDGYQVRSKIVPTNYEGHATAANDRGYLYSTSQGTFDSFTPEWQFAPPGNYDVLDAFAAVRRDFTDSWASDLSYLKGIVDSLNSSQNKFYRFGSHYVDSQSAFEELFNYIQSQSNDNLLVCTTREILEYREMKNLPSTQTLIGNTLKIEVDLSNLSSKNRWKDLSFIINANANITSVTTNGDSSSFNNTSKLVNVYKNDTVPAVNPEVPGNEILVGNGSGSLNLTHQSTGAVPGDVILIKEGNYDTLDMTGLHGLSDKRIYVKNQGVVTFKYTSHFKDLNNVTFAGDFVNSISKGFRYQNMNERGIQCEGEFNSVYIKSVLFKNINNNFIASHFSIFERPYDGTPATRCNDLKLVDIETDNTLGIDWRGAFSYEELKDWGALKGLEVTGCYFHNMPEAGSVLKFENVEDYDIHHNRFENINANTDNHNGVSFMSGSGHFHHNYLNEYQGNAIRMWVFSRGSTPKECNIYNNICRRSRKYSAFEFQSYDRFLWPGKTTTAIGNCFHNTGYMLHYLDNSGTVSGNYYGVILDIFGTSGSVISGWNNVNVDCKYPNITGEYGTSYIYNGYLQNRYDATNRYHATLTAAGLTDITFNVSSGSPLTSGSFRANPISINDYYGNPRNGQPTIGAVQRI